MQGFIRRFIRLSSLITFLLLAVGSAPISGFRLKRFPHCPRTLGEMNTTFLKGEKIVPENYFEILKKYKIPPLRMYTNFYVRRKNTKLIHAPKNITAETESNIIDFVKKYLDTPDDDVHSELGKKEFEQQEVSPTQMPRQFLAECRKVSKSKSGKKLLKAKNVEKRFSMKNYKNPLLSKELELYFKFRYPPYLDSSRNNLKYLRIRTPQEGNSKKYDTIEITFTQAPDSSDCSDSKVSCSCKKCKHKKVPSGLNLDKLKYVPVWKTGKTTAATTPCYLDDNIHLRVDKLTGLLKPEGKGLTTTKASIFGNHK